ncbi:MAG: hypothetical protein JRI26_13570 [Deltaproteobacteria bacterium]|nr:hypothetical protein [Deltaproteobacteria bacterium]
MKLIEKKMKIVEEQVERLKQLSQKIRSLSDYQASLAARDITERNLQVAIEACRKKRPISILLYITVDGVILSFNYSE